MKSSPTIDAENFAEFSFDEFVSASPGSIDTSEPAAVKPVQRSSALDTALAVVKFVFLYIPGAALIHFIMMGFALLYFYGDWSMGLIGVSLGLLVVGTFMTMLGIGKFTDLRYLRVPGALLGAGALAAIVYAVLINFVAGDFFGLYARWTLPLTVLAGYMVKRDTARTYSEIDQTTAGS